MNHISKIRLIFLYLLVIIFYKETSSLLTKNNYQSLSKNNDSNHESIILVWTKPRKTRIYPTYSLEKLELYYGSCFVTGDRNKLSKAKAVIFALNDFNIDDIPRGKRDPNQLWFLFSVDTITEDFLINLASQIKDKKIEFNQTVSYSKKSDLTIENSPGLKKKQIDLQKSSVNVLLKNETIDKSFKATYPYACDVGDWREKYIEEMKKIIKISIPTIANDLACYDERIKDNIKSLASENYFIFMFQKNLCATEGIVLDVWYALKYNLIPIVFGSLNFTDFLPPQSYIDATDLTKNELNERMNAVIISEIEFSKYIQWKEYIEPLEPEKVEPSYQLFTKVCSTIHNRSFLKGKPKKKSKTIIDFQHELLLTQGPRYCFEGNN